MILVTGSTGLVGRHLMLRLTQMGSTVVALYRSDHKKKEVEMYFAFAKAQHLLKNIRWSQGDLVDIPALDKIFDGITQIYHCAALISFDPYDFKKLLKVNVEGTANIVNLCLSHKIKKLVHLSSIATLADHPHHPVTEENYWDPNANNSVYGFSKYGAEMEVLRGTQEGLDAVIFNPGIILGEGTYDSGSGTVFNHVLKEKSFYPTGSTGIIDVKDLAILMIEGMQKKISGERYITIGHNITYKKLFEKIATILQKKPPTRAIPTWSKPVILLVDWLRGIFTRERKITSEGFTSIQSVKKYSTEKLVNTFSYNPTPLKETLERISKHIKENQ